WLSLEGIFEKNLEKEEIPLNDYY